jgi:hypothetical protein
MNRRKADQHGQQDRHERCGQQRDFLPPAAHVSGRACLSDKGDGRLLAAGDGRQEAVPARRNGLDVPLAILTVTQGFAKRRYGVSKVGLLHERVGPHRAQQVLLGDQPSVALYKIDKQIERLRRQGYGLSCSQQQPLPRI